MAIALRILTIADLPAAVALLAEACRWDAAHAVAHEKLFLPGPKVMPTAWGAFADDGDGERLLGVAAQAGDRLRLLAVHPSARGQGIGSRLLAAAETCAHEQGAARLSILGEAGNYLAPGVDERNHEALAWLERRGYERGEQRTNLYVDVRANPRVSAQRYAELVAAAAARGYQVRRAVRGERAALGAAVQDEFGAAWRFEVEHALDEGGVYVALDEGGAYCAFAAHDGNNAGLGWFGPAGTWPEHRGRGLGEAALLGCLLEVALDHPRCEIAWIGPEAFYEKSVGVAGRRTFRVMRKAIAP